MCFRWHETPFDAGNVNREEGEPRGENRTHDADASRIVSQLRDEVPPETRVFGHGGRHRRIPDFILTVGANSPAWIAEEKLPVNPRPASNAHPERAVLKSGEGPAQLVEPRITPEGEECLYLHSSKSRRSHFPHPGIRDRGSPSIGL